MESSRDWKKFWILKFTGWYLSEVLRSRLVEGLAERWVDGLAERLVDSQVHILLLVLETPSVSKKKMADAIGISTMAIDKNINKLKSFEVLTRIGPDRGGRWEITAPGDGV